MVEVAASSFLCKTDKTTLPTSSKSSASAYVLVPLFFFLFILKALAINKAQTSALLLVNSFQLLIAKPHKQELIGFFRTRSVSAQVTAWQSDHTVWGHVSL